MQPYCNSLLFLGLNIKLFGRILTNLTSKTQLDRKLLLENSVQPDCTFLWFLGLNIKLFGQNLQTWPSWANPRWSCTKSSRHTPRETWRSASRRPTRPTASSESLFSDLWISEGKRGLCQPSHQVPGRRRQHVELELCHRQGEGDHCKAAVFMPLKLGRLCEGQVRPGIRRRDQQRKPWKACRLVRQLLRQVSAAASKGHEAQRQLGPMRRSEKQHAVHPGASRGSLQSDPGRQNRCCDDGSSGNEYRRVWALPGKFERGQGEEGRAHPHGQIMQRPLGLMLSWTVGLADQRESDQTLSLRKGSSSEQAQRVPRQFDQIQHKADRDKQRAGISQRAGLRHEVCQRHHQTSALLQGLEWRPGVPGGEQEAAGEHWLGQHARTQQLHLSKPEVLRLLRQHSKAQPSHVAQPGTPVDGDRHAHPCLPWSDRSPRLEGVLVWPVQVAGPRRSPTCRTCWACPTVAAHRQSSTSSHSSPTSSHSSPTSSHLSPTWSAQSCFRRQRSLWNSTLDPFCFPVTHLNLS